MNNPEQGGTDYHTRQLHVGSIVRTQLQGSEAVALFVGTIGSRLESYARKLLPDPTRSLEGFVLDTIGSIAAEAAGDALEKDISDSIADRGWKITNRSSPGCCTWKTCDQQTLFSLFPDQPAGVTLTESSLMNPIKSISGLIGLGHDVERHPYMCDLCSMTTCHHKPANACL